MPQRPPLVPVGDANTQEQLNEALAALDEATKEKEQLRQQRDKARNERKETHERLTLTLVSLDESAAMCRDHINEKGRLRIERDRYRANYRCALWLATVGWVGVVVLVGLLATG